MAMSVLDAHTGKVIRDAADVTIDVLANELGVSRQRASHLEVGRLRRPTNPLLARYGAFLERVLGVSPDP